MKFSMLLVLSVFSLSSWAMHHNHEEMEKKMDSMSFEDAKKMKMEMIEKKSTMLEEEKTCVSNAKDKEALKMCWKKMHEEKEEMMKGKMKMMEKKKK